MRWGETGVAPAVLSEKGSGGRDRALLEETDVLQSLGKRAGFSCPDWNVHSFEAR